MIRVILAGLAVALATSAPAQTEFQTKEGCLSELSATISQQEYYGMKGRFLDRQKEVVPESSAEKFAELVASYQSVAEAYKDIVDTHLALCQTYPN